MNAGTARPSRTRIRGPYVLKIRTIFASTPVIPVIGHRHGLGEALGSSYTPRGPIGFTLPQ
jgi:hypothetical protein